MYSFSKFKAKYHYSLILLRQLVITDFKLRYQGSALGYLWSLLKPLFLFIIMYFVFVHFLRIQGGPHWPVAMLLGIVLWNFFLEITSSSLTAIVGRGDVIRKINFPKYIIILSGGISALINLLLNFVVLAVFMVINGVEFHWSMLVAPVFIFELFVLAIGLSFILSTIYVKFRDIGYIWDVLAQALFYGSAIVYPLSMVLEKSSSLTQVLLLNPVAQSIQGARHTLVDSSNIIASDLTNNPIFMIIPVVIVIGLFVLGAWLFKKKSPYFAENV